MIWLCRHLCMAACDWLVAVFFCAYKSIFYLCFFCCHCLKDKLVQETPCEINCCLSEARESQNLMLNVLT